MPQETKAHPFNAEDSENVGFALKNGALLPVDKWIKISEKSAGDEPD